jgi:hypothetical protein
MSLSAGSGSLAIRLAHLALLAEIGDLDRRDLDLARLVGGDHQRELAPQLAVAQVLLGLLAIQHAEGVERDGAGQVDGDAAPPDGGHGQVDGVADVRLRLVDARRDGGRVGVGRQGGQPRDCARAVGGSARARVALGSDGPRRHRRGRRREGDQGGEGPARAASQCRSLRARASKKVVSAGR